MYTTPSVPFFLYAVHPVCVDVLSILNKRLLLSKATWPETFSVVFLPSIVKGTTSHEAFTKSNAVLIVNLSVVLSIKDSALAEAYVLYKSVKFLLFVSIAVCCFFNSQSRVVCSLTISCFLEASIVLLDVASILTFSESKVFFATSIADVANVI